MGQLSRTLALKPSARSSPSSDSRVAAEKHCTMESREKNLQLTCSLASYTTRSCTTWSRTRCTPEPAARSKCSLDSPPRDGLEAEVSDSEKWNATASYDTERAHYCETVIRR